MSKTIQPFNGEFCELPLMLNADDIARVLRISRAYAYEMLHDKSLPVIVIGKRRMVERNEFRSWIESRKTKEA